MFASERGFTIRGMNSINRDSSVSYANYQQNNNNNNNATNSNGTSNGTGSSLNNTNNNNTIAYRSFSGGLDLNTTSSQNGGENDNVSIDAIEDFVEYAQQEAKLAVFVRAIFIIVMILSAVLVAVATNRYVTNQEARAFETKFIDFGTSMVNAVQINAKNTKERYEIWSLQITNIIQATNQTWPNVAVPYFETQALQSMEHVGARIIGLSPLVRDSLAWGRYSVDNVATWAQQSLEEYYMDDDPMTTPSISVDDIQPPPFVYHRTPPPIQPAAQPLVDNIYLPLWQVFPIESNYFIINYDAFNFTFVPRVFEQMAYTGRPVLSEGFLVPSGDDDNVSAPESFMAAPIYNHVLSSSSSSSSSSSNNNNNNRFLVGVLFAFFPWSDHFNNLLPEETPEICVVIRNDCVESFTYTVQGPTVSFQGMGDLHDREYSHLEVSYEFDGESSFDNVPNCTNTIHIFPTKVFEEEYTTSTSITYTLAAVGIFMLTTIIFAIYDCYSQRWRKKVEVQARRNSAIVQSLFPPTVRDRLMGTDGEGEDYNHNNNNNNNNGDSNGMNNGAYGNGANGGDPNNMQTIGPGGLGRKMSMLVGRDAVLTRLPDLIPDLRALTNKMPDLQRLNPMRLLEEITNISLKEKNQMNNNGNNGNNNNNNGGGDQQSHQNTMHRREDKPIADLFPSATVLFGDISGFTAWSSQRDPAQVFTLLENIYNAFDKIAKRRKVFKVETIGDCYMAATGLPEVRNDHAILMAGFARECLATMNEVVRDLEAQLGPDTGDLAMRFGIHSGPVTAGVLRGEKSRFQLFGDTVNTASRMESTGVRHKIQISQETADLLIAKGKESWIVPREDLVEAKGKGRLQTYWLAVGAVGATSQTTRLPNARRISFKPRRRSSITSNDWDGSFRIDPTMEEVVRSINQKIERMIDWNVQVLSEHLTSVLRYRHKQQQAANALVVPERALQRTSISEQRMSTSGSSTRSLLSVLNNDAPASEPLTLIPEAVVSVPPKVLRQLTEFVTAIAFMYHDNPFHNFEHASHVTQSVNKLLARLVEPTQPDTLPTEPKEATQYALHMHTFETAADPTLKFAVAFAALIHDVEHPGVPNTQLVHEKPDLANRYNGRSVAEKNSVDMAWTLLMESSYKELRDSLFANRDELGRFRRLVVKTVLATDIADKQMGDLRRQRWADQFDNMDDTNNNNNNNTAALVSEDELEKRAEMFMECIIQASDVSHTMQHWQIYIKWNERLFHECYHAYQTGRAPSGTGDPSKGWYKGELSFFDFYIIPLIARLKLLEIFGATTDEFMTYAQANRKEWEAKGKRLVDEYLERYDDYVFDETDSVIVT